MPNNGAHLAYRFRHENSKRKDHETSLACVWLTNLEKEFRPGFATFTVVSLKKKNMNFPDETRSFENGIEQVSTVDDTTLTRFTLQPGWQWATSIKPAARTKSCQLKHTVYLISGKMKVRMNDGSIITIIPGDFAVIPPGHDARAIGDEPCVGVEFNQAKPDAE